MFNLVQNDEGRQYVGAPVLQFCSLMAKLKPLGYKSYWASFSKPFTPKLSVAHFFQILKTH